MSAAAALPEAAASSSSRTRLKIKTKTKTEGKKLIRFWWFDGVVVVAVKFFYIIFSWMHPLCSARLKTANSKLWTLYAQLLYFIALIVCCDLFFFFLLLLYQKILIGIGTCLCGHCLFSAHAEVQAFSILSHRVHCATTATYSMQNCTVYIFRVHRVLCAQLRNVKVQLICERCHTGCKHI